VTIQLLWKYQKFSLLCIRMSPMNPIMRDRILIFLLGSIFFLPFLGNVHLFDWDEINFAEAAREMIVTGKYYMVQINYLPFWQKPPLFIWMQALSMNLFGIGEYGARFPNAVCGIISLLTFYEIGRREHDRKFGFYWALAYLASLLPHLYFKSGIMDPWFNYFIFLSVYFFYRYAKDSTSSWKLLFLSASFSGLGIMTKGPVALLMLGLTVLCITLVQKKWLFRSMRDLLIFCSGLLLFGGFWFLEEILSGRSFIIEQFITYQIKLLQTEDAGHAGPFFYHPLVVLIGCFPISVFALTKLFKFKSLKEHSMAAWMIALFWLVLLVFSIVQTKIVHYSSLAYLPLSYLAAYSLKDRISGLQFSKVIRIVLPIIGIALLLIFIALPYLGMHIEILRGLEIKDPFARGNLEAEVVWSFLDFSVALLFALSLILYFSKKTPLWIPLISNALSVALLLILFVPKIEAYSQRSAIEFYKEQQGKDVYVAPLGYKSYAHLFYTAKQIPTDSLHHDVNWLTSGKADRPTRFISKVQHEETFISSGKLKVIGRKNGFVFYERK